MSEPRNTDRGEAKRREARPGSTLPRALVSTIAAPLGQSPPPSVPITGLGVKNSRRASAYPAARSFVSTFSDGYRPHAPESKEATPY